jgi:hypothetical protein
MGWVGAGLVGVLLMGTPWLAAAQSIYTCVDSKGRRLTHDRPIADCIDREQRELYSNGTVKRSIGPTLTEREADIEELRQRKEAEDRARLQEAKRRDRALVARYQNTAAHDAERADALRQVDEVIAIARRRQADLDLQRAKLDAELEFYKRDPASVPAALKQRITEHAADVAAQNRFIADQEQEKKRINARFDTELVRLRQLWLQRSSVTTDR